MTPSDSVPDEPGQHRPCPNCMGGGTTPASTAGTSESGSARPERLAIGLMGAAGGNHSEDARRQAFALGVAVARRGAVLVTGACPGLPHEGVLGAKSEGGMTVGISPGLSLHEHRIKYGSPHEGYDVLVYTGSGLMGREVTNIRTSDIVIIAGGRSGTLGEFAIAFDEGKLIGVLEGSGGITTILPTVTASFSKATGAEVLYDADPGRLLDRLIERYRTHHFARPSCFCDPCTPTL